jgi:hypothetical protein
MTERLSDAMAQMLDEGKPRSEAALRALLHARLAGNLSEGLAHDSGRNGRASDDDSALIAAFLDGAATPAEREAIAAKLAADPATRADLVSVMALLDDIAAQPEEVPAGLAERAAEIFAPDPAPAMQTAGGGWLQSLVSASRWRSAPGPRFALAAVLIVAIATPAVLQVAWHGGGAGLDGQDSGPVGRGLAPAAAPMQKPPAVTAKEVQGCEPSETPAVAAASPADRKTPPPPAPKRTVNGTAVPSPTAQNGTAVQSPTAQTDPCGRKAPAQNLPAGRRN